MLGAAGGEHVEIALGETLGRMLVDRIERVHQAVAERVGVDVERRVDEMRDVHPERLVARLDLDRRPEALALHAEPELADPLGGELTVLALGVNRALEGLAIDVFTTMKEFGELAGDPYLEFCEDWMLADEVTHVKMGSDWLRKITENDPERRKKALEFQGVVDKMFSYGGSRSDSEESSFAIARRFRELAGFTEDENDHIADLGMQALNERKAQLREKQAAAAN